MARSFWLFRISNEERDPCELFTHLRSLKPFKGINLEKVYELAKQMKENPNLQDEITDFDDGFDKPRRIRDAFNEYICTIKYIRASVTLTFSNGVEWPIPRSKTTIIQLWSLIYNNDFYIIISTGDDKLVDNVILKYLENIGIDINNLEKISIPRGFIRYVNEYPGNPPILSQYNIENIGLYGKEGADWIKAAFGSSERKEIPKNIEPKDSMRLMIPVPYKKYKSIGKKREEQNYIKAWFYSTGKIALSSRGDIDPQKYEIENLLHAALLVNKIARIWKEQQKKKIEG